MRKLSFSLLLLVFFIGVKANTYHLPIVGEDVVFEEKNGLVSVEAEFFYKQTKSEVRQWYRTSKNENPSVGRDEDKAHVLGASNNAYLEILPDTRVTHGDKLIKSENFSDGAGTMAVAHYKVYFNAPGKYYVWARAYSSGSEDNGLHVGLDGEWPESGQRMQWCEGKNTWRWESKQRTEKQHCGEQYGIYLEIKKAGIHDIQFSMREDGFEFDKFLMTTDRDYVPSNDAGPAVQVKTGQLPAAYPEVEAVVSKPKNESYVDVVAKSVQGVKMMKAVDFPIENTQFYKNGTWLAINPSKAKEATCSMAFPYEDGMYDVVFVAVGENDGKSEYTVWINDNEIGSFTVPMSDDQFAEGPKHNDLWENIALKKGDIVKVLAKVGSADGKEYSRGRWAGIAFAPMTKGKDVLATSLVAQKAKEEEQMKEPELKFSDRAKRMPDGDASVEMSGELKQWHKVTLTLDGPFAHELDTDNNPFTDYNMMVTFTHSSGSPSYKVPGYFAADGNAGETGADSGIKWRAHLSPDKTGKWNYSVAFSTGKNAALENNGKEISKYSNLSGQFTIGKTDKEGRDFRSKGRLEYVGKHHLQFQGSKEYFIKAGADAPETLLAYEDFDATYTMKAKVPVKTYAAHKADWKEGYPTWKNGKGKALIGAIAYLSDKGVNAFSFLTYNAGGDGDNVWPFVKRNEKFHYDCSKLDQWSVLFDFAQSKGMYLHFKTQETENDDNVLGSKGKAGVKTESLDGGELGLERKLYYRELVARYGYLLALNWNMGEENTQTTKQQQDMVEYMSSIDPYKHNVVLHTFPGQQNKVYNALLGQNSKLTGVSLQNEWDHVFKQTLLWCTLSDSVNRPWVVANDEQGSAGEGVPPDPGYKGFDAAKMGYDLNDVRKQTLYGNFMAGGAGVEYYFGYKLPENDVLCEEFGSKDKSWEYCKIGIGFFQNNVPFQDMKNADALVGNTNGNKEKHCLAKEGSFYLVYLAYTKTTSLDLSNAKGKFNVKWFNPRTGGDFHTTSISKVKGGSTVELGNPPADVNDDWFVVISK